MPVIAMMFGSFCHGEEVAGKVAAELEYSLLKDDFFFARAAGNFRMDEGKLRKAVTGKTSVFNQFTHERERALAYLKATLAESLTGDNLLLLGFLAHLIPPEISHVLKVCLIADIRRRVREARRVEGISEKDALKRIHKDDEGIVLWTEYLFQRKDPWAPDLYDILLPMGKDSVDRAAAVICENVRKQVLMVSDQSRRGVEDFILASRVNVKLAEEGHDVQVSARDGHVRVTINKKVLRLSALEEELKKLALSVPSVRSVETRVGAGYYQTDIYRKYEFDVPLPTKVLLVDDEREFVETLSERLRMREVSSAVAYNGREALDVVDADEPEVMVLDLKMPGIDGLEVLRKVRDEHPDVEVIVLTGHGSEEIRRICMEMGACAYLEKPVEMENLTAAMKEAYDRVKQRKARQR